MMLAEPEDMEERARWLWALADRRAAYRWRHQQVPCQECGRWIGHWGGDTTTGPCKMIPDDVPLEEVRPNCYEVRRLTPWIGDAVRKACKD